MQEPRTHTFSGQRVKCQLLSSQTVTAGKRLSLSELWVLRNHTITAYFLGLLERVM